ncbi:MAG TPA: TetR/AcrR family transcriptional regulator C-terminal domain-containing protein [Candidatus Limnocylindrales bacterium]
MTNVERASAERLEARTPLTRERVLRAAVELADAEGLEALSMRRLAQALGVEAMSLYYYVASKDELRADMVGLIQAEIVFPHTGDWKADLRGGAMAARDALIRHPWAAGLVQSVGPSPARLAFMEAVLGTLRGAGLSAAQTDHAYHAIDCHITGFTLWQSAFPFRTDEELAELAGAFRQTLSADDFPYLLEHIDEHIEPSDAEEVSEFAFGLDLILDGVERMLPSVTTNLG